MVSCIPRTNLLDSSQAQKLSSLPAHWMLSDAEEDMGVLQEWLLLWSTNHSISLPLPFGVGGSWGYRGSELREAVGSF